jgi:hypothetical protein
MSRIGFCVAFVLMSGVALGQDFGSSFVLNADTQQQGAGQPSGGQQPGGEPPLNREDKDLEYYSGLKQEEPRWNFDTSITAGISYLVFNHVKNNVFYSRTGAYVDGNVNFHLPDLHLPVMFGVGVTASGFWDNDSFLGVEALYSQINMLSAEARVSVPIMLDEQDSGPFLLPRIGVGPLFDYYGVQTPFGQTKYHNGAAVEVRPSIEFGYRYGEMAFGVEFSYMWAWGSFGDFGSQAQEVRGGLLFSYRF